MPDWFYHPVSRPLLFRLSARRARDLALGFMGRLARLPFGPLAIDFLGHMRADPRLKCSWAGVEFPTAVGLGPALDAEATALPALVRFGYGFLDIGPITLEAHPGARPMERRAAQEALWLPDPPPTLALAAVIPRLVEAGRLGLPLLVRLACAPQATPAQATNECQCCLRVLAPDTSIFILQTLRTALREGWPLAVWEEHVRQLVHAAQELPTPRPLLLAVPADFENSVREPFLDAVRAAGIRGWVVDGCVECKPEGLLFGRPARDTVLSLVRRLAPRKAPGDLLIAGSVHQPQEALDLLDAGADLVEVDTGLIFTGPGLPKRINEALLYERVRQEKTPPPIERPAEMTWFWTLLMGGGMFFGSLLTLLIAATRVILHYDESFVGLSRAELTAINPRLLAFMAHDRVSLAGTMVSLGLLYLGLSWFGIRRGLHWAQVAVFVSAFVGFASFFAFLGFGYLDPLHAFVTAVLLQLLLLGVHSRLGTYTPTTEPGLVSDRAWRWSQWGQLLLVLHGVMLLAAGMTITVIGSTFVFVPEDLAFMQTTAEALQNAHPRLVPLVAHDRATFGGMILSNGWAFLLVALWGFRRGNAWLWWTLLVAGLAAYVPAILVHFMVGYTDIMHLTPAFSGLGIFLVGQALAFPYLCNVDIGPDPSATEFA